MSAAAVMAVRVTPRSGRDSIESVDDDGAVRLRVTASSTEGAANRAVVRLVARTLGLPRSAVVVAGGAASRHKRLRLEGVSAAQLRARWPDVSASEG